MPYCVTNSLLHNTIIFKAYLLWNLFPVHSPGRMVFYSRFLSGQRYMQYVVGKHFINSGILENRRHQFMRYIPQVFPNLFQPIQLLIYHGCITFFEQRTHTHFKCQQIITDIIVQILRYPFPLTLQTINIFTCQTLFSLLL